MYRTGRSKKNYCSVSFKKIDVETRYGRRLFIFEKLVISSKDARGYQIGVVDQARHNYCTRTCIYM